MEIQCIDCAHEFEDKPDWCKQGFNKCPKCGAEYYWEEEFVSTEHVSDSFYVVYWM